MIRRGIRRRAILSRKELRPRHDAHPRGASLDPLDRRHRLILAILAVLALVTRPRLGGLRLDGLRLRRVAHRPRGGGPDRPQPRLAGTPIRLPGATVRTEVICAERQDRLRARRNRPRTSHLRRPDRHGDQRRRDADRSARRTRRIERRRDLAGRQDAVRRGLDSKASSRSTLKPARSARAIPQSSRAAASPSPPTDRPPTSAAKTKSTSSMSLPARSRRRSLAAVPAIRSTTPTTSPCPRTAAPRG